MTKVGFFLDIKNSCDSDLTNIMNGNPGIGGTQFCFALVVNRLAVLYPNEWNIFVFSPVQLHLPSNCKNIIVNGEDELLGLAANEGISYLVIKTPLNKSFYQKIIKYKDLKIICWAHNYFNAHIADYISKQHQIVSVVFVGKQMYDFYYDNDVIKKSTFIHNPVPDSDKRIFERKYEPYTLVYMGSIVKDKGILQLLKIWSYIEKQYPDAVLKIIGSGKLYNKDSRLGDLGIAEARLEEQMKKYIIDNDTGKIKKNIRFLGIMGEEKYDVFRKAAVGIVNPSAQTETFGMGIVEMATMQLPVVTKGWNGHFDTIIDGKTGFTAFSAKGIARKISVLFDDQKINVYMGEKAKENVESFNPDKIASRWKLLLDDLNNGKIEWKHQSLSRPYWNNYKFIRYIGFLLRFKLRLRFLPSTVTLETLINDTIKKLR